MAFTATQLRTKVDCTCGKWHWRDITAMAGLGVCATQKFCPRCRRDHLVVFRVKVGRQLQVRLLNVVPLEQDNEVALRTALRQVEGLDDDEREFLIAVARVASREMSVG